MAPYRTTKELWLEGRIGCWAGEAHWPSVYPQLDLFASSKHPGISVQRNNFTVTGSIPIVWMTHYERTTFQEKQKEKVDIRIGSGRKSTQRQNSKATSAKSILFQSHKTSQNDLRIYAKSQLQGGTVPLLSSCPVVLNLFYFLHPGDIDPNPYHHLPGPASSWATLHIILSVSAILAPFSPSNKPRCLKPQDLCICYSFAWNALLPTALPSPSFTWFTLHLSSNSASLNLLKVTSLAVIMNSHNTGSLFQVPGITVIILACLFVLIEVTVVI